MSMLSLLAAAATISIASTVSAQSLVLGGQIGTEGGGGLGNQLTILTLQSRGNDNATGCIEPTGINPSCEVDYPDAFVQQQSFEQWIEGLTGENLRIVYNSSEPGNGENGVILNALTLYVYGGPTGSRTLLGSFDLNTPSDLSETYNGTGTFGFVYYLNPAGAADFDAAIAGQQNLTVGLGAEVLNSTGGLETFSLALGEGGGGGPNEVPEPSSVLLVMSGLGALGVTARRRRAGRTA